MISDLTARRCANEKIVISLKSTYLCVKCVRNRTVSLQNKDIFLKSLQRGFFNQSLYLTVNVLRLLLALDIVINNNWTSLLYILIYFTFHSCALFHCIFFFVFLFLLFCVLMLKIGFSLYFNTSKFCSIK